MSDSLMFLRRIRVLHCTMSVIVVLGMLTDSPPLAVTVTV